MSITIRIGDLEKRQKRTILQPEQGGLGTVSLEGAKTVLQVVDKSTIGQPGGPVGLDNEGKIDANLLDLVSIQNYPTLKVISGLSSSNEIYLNTDIVYEITNFDSNKTYTVSNTNNCTAVVNNNYVTFRASGAGAHFTLNGRKVKPEVVIPVIRKPVITTPNNNAIIDHSSISVITSGFNVTGKDGEEHASTYYKITSDAAGNTIIYSSGADSENLTNKVINLSTPLTGGSTVYIRVMHVGSTLGNSEWSDPVACTVASLTKPSITNMVNGTELNVVSYTFTSSSFGTTGSRTHASTSWKVVKTSDESVVIAESVDDTTNLTSWTASGLTPNETLKVYVRYKDTGGMYTEWSDAINFSIVINVSQPTITYPVSGDTYNNGNMTISASEFSVTGGVYTHGSSTWQVAKDLAFTDVVQESIDDTSNLTSYACSNLPIDVTLYARVKYKDSNGNSSLWSPVVTFSITVAVNTPTVSATYVDPFSATLSGSSFAVSNGDTTTYPHTSTDWQVSTSSSFSSYLVNVTKDTSNKTSYKLSNLTNNTTYYVRVRYYNETLGYSEWSNVINFKTLAVVTGGRSFYRHSSGKGTVMTWKNKSGGTHNTLVLDAAYRSEKPWYGTSSNYSKDVSGLTNYTNNGYYYNNGSSQSTTATNDLGITDSTINSYSSYFEDSGTSRNNTTNIISSIGSSTSYAAGYCRSITVNSTTCDLPNIQTLIRIHASMFKLDSLDPSGSGKQFFTKAKTGKSNNWMTLSSGYGGFWSSTEYSSTTAWNVYYNGYVFNLNKYNQYGVCPVLEV